MDIQQETRLKLKVLLNNATSISKETALDKLTIAKFLKGEDVTKSSLKCIEVFINDVTDKLTMDQDILKALQDMVKEFGYFDLEITNKEGLKAIEQAKNVINKVL